MSLRWRLGTAVAAGMLAVALAAAGVLEALARRSSARAQERAIGLLADEVSAVARESALAGDPLMLVDRLAELEGRRPELAHARVELGGRWSDVGPVPPPGAGPFRVVPIAGGPRAELWLSRGALDAASRRERADARRDLALVGAAALAAGWGLGLLLALGLSRRLAGVEDALASLAEGRPPDGAPDPRGDELGRLSRAVHELSGRLREVDAMKKTFIATVTHELRSPLAAIESRARLLLATSALPAEDRRSLERILDNAGRLSRFVTSVLDLARVERGRLDYRPRPSDLARVVADVAEFLAPRARESGVAVVCEVEPGLPAVRLDPDLVAQAATNLIDNAIKFSPRGGRVAVAVRRAAGGLECSVADQGPGVPAEARARLFRPFERAAGVRVPGAGLGLALSRAIVERHGGRLELADAPGGGSVFRFVLPLNVSENTPDDGGPILRP